MRTDGIDLCPPSARSGHSVTNRLLSGRSIVYVGTISYSLYLFHFLTPPIALHGRHFDSYTSTAAGFHAVSFVAIRRVADQLLGLRSAPSAGEQGVPAE
jgi:hypothetical protein